MIRTLNELKSAFENKADFSIEAKGGKTSLKITPKIKSYIDDIFTPVSFYKGVLLVGDQINIADPGDNLSHTIGFERDFKNSLGTSISEIASKGIYNWSNPISFALSRKPTDYGIINLQDYVAWIISWYEKFTALSEKDKQIIYSIDDKKTNDAMIKTNIAIFGLGGTGSHILEGLVKNKVKNIHIYDRDRIEEKNLYRFPGNLSKNTIKMNKVDAFNEYYSEYDSKIFPNNIDVNDITSLNEIDFAFVSLDNFKARSSITTVLMSSNIPFIVVGMSMDFQNNNKDTYFASCTTSIYVEGEVYENEKDSVDAYKQNIQIYEMNSLNANIAIIMFKKWSKFYFGDIDKKIRFITSPIRMDKDV